MASAARRSARRRRCSLRFLELVEKVRQTRPASDIELLRRAFEFAAEQHRTQLRKSGDPYLSHPLEVAHILADMKLDITTLCAALLHDVVEDTRVSTQRIAERFGPDIATLVEGVTKINRLDLLAPEARQAENVRKMLLAMVNDVRVVVVKLADRLHNMRTLGFLSPEKQQRIARETLDIYAPDRAPPGNGFDPRRARGSRLQLPRARGLPGAAKYRCRQAKGIRDISRRN